MDSEIGGDETERKAFVAKIRREIDELKRACEVSPERSVRRAIFVLEAICSRFELRVHDEDRDYVFDPDRPRARPFSFQAIEALLIVRQLAYTVAERAVR